MKEKLLVCIMVIGMLMINVISVFAEGTTGQAKTNIQTEETQSTYTDLSEIVEDGKEEKIEISEEDLPDNNQLFAGYAERKMYGDEISLYGLDTSRVLSETDKKIYDVLKENIKKVADGELVSTVFQVSLADVYGSEIMKQFTAKDLGVDAIVTGGTITTEAKNVIYDKIRPDYKSINQCLLLNCPYEMYWYDKTNGVSVSYPGIIGNSSYLCFNGETITFSFCVASEYAVGGTIGLTDADTSKTGAVITAVTNAKEIVDKHSGEDDYTKLGSYRQEICDLVSYNDDAASDDTTPYGNPWQLIWVFDGDSSTNVVCEGYSKAFQYLCDLSQFESEDMNCRTVSGVMDGGTGAGAHMWNIMTMDDNQNYLVDITNCDTGTVGADDKLFLAVPLSGGSINGGYTFQANFTNIAYKYNSNTIALYDENVLAMSNSAYSYCSHKWDNGRITKEATCASEGEKVFTCSLCQKEKTEAISKIAHSPKVLPAKEASCTEDGLTEGSQCSVCNVVLIKQEVISATGHEYDAWETIIEVNCINNGKQERTCKNCGEKETKVIPAAGHQNTEKRGKKEATCMKEGYTGDTYCKDCGEKISSGKSIAELSHIWNAGTITKKATYDKSGIKTYICKVCKTKKTETIAKLVRPVTIKKVSGIKLTGISKNIAAGKKITLSAEIYPINASNKKLKWTSGNTKVATVTQNGVVTIKKKTGGKSVWITAVALDGGNKKAAYKIKVMKGVVKKVSISGAKSIKAGKSLKLKGKVKAAKGANKKLKWISSNTKYATVSSSGKVKTLKTGKGKKVKITAMATDGSGKKKTVTIKIK